MNWKIDGKLPATPQEKEVIVSLEAIGLSSQATLILDATAAAGRPAKAPEQEGQANEKAVAALKGVADVVEGQLGDIPLVQWCRSAAFERELIREHGFPMGKVDPETGADVMGEDTGRGPIYIALGHSNGKAVHEATGARVYAECSWLPGKLEELGKRLAERERGRPIVVCADGTREGERQAAAVAWNVGAAVVVARLTGGDMAGCWTSFAGLLKAEGPAAVSRQVREGACKAVELRRQGVREAEGPARDAEHSPAMSR
ncbi:MAG: hypothetical protein OXS47_04030 [Chloroflexota bacterium]|nr:hypothetical protein [Chloroflexota bacterium]